MTHGSDRSALFLRNGRFRGLEVAITQKQTGVTCAGVSDGSAETDGRERRQ